MRSVATIFQRPIEHATNEESLVFLAFSGSQIVLGGVGGTTGVIQQKKKKCFQFNKTTWSGSTIQGMSHGKFNLQLECLWRDRNPTLICYVLKKKKQL